MTDNETISYEEALKKVSISRVDWQALCAELAEALATCRSGQGFMNDQMSFDYDKVTTALVRYKQTIEG